MRRTASQLHITWRRLSSRGLGAPAPLWAPPSSALWPRSVPRATLSTRAAAPPTHDTAHDSPHTARPPPSTPGPNERRNLSQLVEPVLNGKLDVADLSSKEANQLIWASSKGDKSGRSFQLYDRIKGVHPIYPLSFRYLFISSSHFPQRTPELLKDLRASGLDTTDLVLGGLLVAMCNQAHTERALKIFERMRANSGAVAWFESSVLIAHLIDAGRGAEARAVYERCGADYDKMLYYKFLQAAIAHKDFALAHYFYQAMGAHHVRLEGRVVESMLSAGVAAQQYEQVYHMAQDILASPAASAPVYEILFRALLKDPALDAPTKVARALEYFERFVGDRIPLTPQSTLLERVLDILAESEDLPQVRAFLDALHSHHYTVPSSMVYRIAEKFEGHDELVPLIVRLLDATKATGTPAVRALVYYKMIALHVGRGQMGRALSVCREMGHVGLVPNTMTYTQLLSVATSRERGDVDLAWAIKGMSARERVPLTRPLYNALVDVALAHHREELLPALWEEMQAKQMRLAAGPHLEALVNAILVGELLGPQGLGEPTADHPPRRTNEQSEQWYGQLKEFFLLLVQGQQAEARALLTPTHLGPLPSLLAAYLRFVGKTTLASSSSSSSPTETSDDELFVGKEAQLEHPLVVEAQLEVAAYHQRASLVETYWAQLMALQEGAPSVWAYENVLVSRVQAQQSGAQIGPLVEEMKAQGWRLSARAQTAVVQAYGHHQQWAEARAFLAQQDDPPAEAVGALVDAYCQQGQRDEALTFLLDGPHSLVTGEMLRPLVQAYGAEEDRTLLRAVLEQLREAKVSLSELAHAFPSSSEARAFLYPPSDSTSE